MTMLIDAGANPGQPTVSPAAAEVRAATTSATAKPTVSATKKKKKRKSVDGGADRPVTSKPKKPKAVAAAAKPESETLLFCISSDGMHTPRTGPRATSTNSARGQPP